MSEYFNNFSHRNIHVTKYEEFSEKQYLVAFQTNWTNHWYYCNDKGTIGNMRFPSKANRFDTEDEAKAYMQSVFKNLVSNGQEMIHI